MFDVAPANGKLIVSGPLAKSQSGAVRSNDVTSVPFGITAVMSAALGVCVAAANVTVTGLPSLSVAFVPLWKLADGLPAAFFRLKSAGRPGQRVFQ